MKDIWFNVFVSWYSYLILDTNIHKQPTPITNKLTILGSFDDDFDFNDEEVDTNDGDDQSDDVGNESEHN